VGETFVAADAVAIWKGSHQSRVNVCRFDTANREIDCPAFNMLASVIASDPRVIWWAARTAADM
jgi:hypothetical protein